MRNILLILFTLALASFARPAQAQVILKTGSIQIPCSASDTFWVPVTVQNFDGVGSFQFTLSWNPSNLDYIYTSSMNPQFLGANAIVGFDTTNFINTGKMTFFWTYFGGLSVPDDTEVFSVAFVRTGGGVTPVEFVGTPSVVEVTDPNGNELPSVIMSGAVTPIDTQAPVIVCPDNVLMGAALPIPVPNIDLDSQSDDCEIANIGFATTGATMVNAPNDPDASGTVFNIGQTVVTYTATDNGNNTGTCSFQVTIEFNSTDLTILAGSGSGSCGDVIAIPVTTQNFDNIASLQFSMEWPEAFLQYDSVGALNSALQLSGSNFGTSFSNTGMLSFAWTIFGPTPVSLNDGDTLFVLYYTVISANGGSNSLTFGDVPTPVEAYQGNQQVPVAFLNGVFDLSDNVPPTISCPMNVAVNADQGTTTATLGGLAPSLMDNCNGTIGLTYVATGATPGAGVGPANGTYNAGNTIVTYTASDLAGNTATCSFTVTVDAGNVLTLFIDSVYVDCQGSGQTISFDVSVLNFSNIWGLQFSIEWDESVLQFQSVTNLYPGLGLSGASFIGYTSTPMGILRFLDGNSSTGWPTVPDGSTMFTINFSVANPNAQTGLNFIAPFDAVDNTFSTIPFLTINGAFVSLDTVPPVFTFCPTDTTVTALPNDCSAVLNLPLATATDACSGLLGISSNQADNIFDAGATQVVYTATDSVGNSSTCAFTVNVLDGIMPGFINCPDTIFAYVGNNCTAVVNWQPPIAVAGCSSGPLPTVTSTYSPGDTFQLGESEVEYTVTDFSGNTGTCTFIVIVSDSTAPVLVCPSNLTVSGVDSTCHTLVTYPAPSASDNCDTDVLVIASNASGSSFPVGITMIDFTAFDNYGNSSSCSMSVTVEDTLSPILVCPSDTVFYVLQDTCGVYALWTVPTATDDCSSGTLIPTSSFAPGDFFGSGETTVTYLVADDYGNVATCSFKITVIDTITPTITSCPGNVLIELPSGVCDTIVSWTAPTALDNCMLDSLSSNYMPGDTFPTGTVTVVYTAVDVEGNVASCSFDVSVLDKINPQFTSCPTDTVIMGASACGVVLDWSLPIATDNCDPNPEIFAQPMPGDTFLTGTTVVVIYARDASGNFDTCTFTVMVQSLGTPGFTNVPANMVFYGCEAVANWTAPTAAGFCTAPDTIFANYMPGDTFYVGQTTVVYTAIDQIGLTYTASFTVTVLDTVPPSVICPQSIVVNTGAVVLSDPSEFVVSIDTAGNCTGVAMSLLWPSASDNCSFSLVQTAGPDPDGDFYGIGSTTMSFEVTDGSGNTSVCSFSVNVLSLRLMSAVVTPNPGCAGDFVTLTVDSFPGANYFWTGPLQSYPNTHQITIAGLSAGNQGTYTVYASINGCSTPVDTAEVLLAIQPIANDDLNITVLAGDTVNFSVVENDIFLANDAVLTLLSPLDGLSNLGSGQFSYDSGETLGKVSFVYEICSEACPDLCDMATVTINILSTKCDFVPNVFTPNGDGFYDYLTIPCLDSGLFESNSIVIYNQWGDKVFEAAPYSNAAPVAWDGTLNNQGGDLLPDGVYFYIFKPSASDAPVKGFIQIFR